MKHYMAISNSTAVMMILFSTIIYGAAFLIFPESVFPESWMSIFYVVITFLIVFHEVLHGIAARIVGIPAKDITIHFRFEQLLAFCELSTSVSRNKFIVFLLAPFLIIGLMCLLFFSLTEHVFFLIIAWVNVAMSTFDLLYFFYVIFFPSSTIIGEQHGEKDSNVIMPPAGYSKSLGFLCIQNISKEKLDSITFCLMDPVEPIPFQAKKPNQYLRILRKEVRILKGSFFFSIFSLVIFTTTIIELVLIVYRHM